MEPSLTEISRGWLGSAQCSWTTGAVTGDEIKAGLQRLFCSLVPCSCTLGAYLEVLWALHVCPVLSKALHSLSQGIYLSRL